MQKKCPVCDKVMTECHVSPDSSAYGLMVSKVSPVMSAGVKIKAAICENCGEISLYIDKEDIKKIF